MLATEWLRKVAQGRHYPPIPGLQSPRDNQEGPRELAGTEWVSPGLGRNLERGGRATQRCAVSRTATSDSVSGPSQETHLGKSALPGVGDEGERGSAFCLRCYSTRGMVQASSRLERQTSWFKVVGEGSGSNSVEPQSVSSPTQERVHPSVSFAEWAGTRPSKRGDWGPCLGLPPVEDTRLILRQAGDLGFFAFPRGYAGPCDPLGGCGSRNRRSPGKTLSSARAEVPLGTTSPAAQRVPGRVPKPPGSPPRPSPCPEPLTRLGCRAPLRAPQCRLQLRLQLGSRSGSCSRSDAVALGMGWGVAPLRLGLLCVQGRGAPAGPGRTDPHPRSPNEPLAAVSGALPCPALPQPRLAARRRLRAAARATVTLLGPSRRRRGFQVSARRRWRRGPGHR